MELFTSTFTSTFTSRCTSTFEYYNFRVRIPKDQLKALAESEVYGWRTDGLGGKLFSLPCLERKSYAPRCPKNPRLSTVSQLFRISLTRVITSFSTLFKIRVKIRFNSRVITIFLQVDAKLCVSTGSHLYSYAGIRQRKFGKSGEGP